MSDGLTIREGGREITITGKTVERLPDDSAVYLIPGIGQLIMIGDLLTGNHELEWKTTLHTSRGDFSGLGRTPEEAEEKAWRRLEEETGFSRPR